MIIVARLHSDKNPGAVWDFIIQNHHEMNERLGNDVKLLYASMREKHEFVSVFMHVNDIEALGKFISQEIAQIDSVDGVWINALINPRFFPIPKGTLHDLKRYTISIQAYPRSVASIYDMLCATPVTPEFVVTYVANTFHMFSDSLVVSILAKNRKLVDQFASRKIEALPGMLQTRVHGIKSTHRLIPREQWEKYANIFPETSGAD